MNASISTMVIDALGGEWQKVGGSGVLRKYPEVSQLIWLRKSRVDSTVQLILSLSCPTHGIGGDNARDIRLSGLSADISSRGLGRERWWTQAEIADTASVQACLRVISPFLAWASEANAVRVLASERQLPVPLVHIAQEKAETRSRARASEPEFQEFLAGLASNLGHHGFRFKATDRQNAFIRVRDRWLDVLELRRDEFGATWTVAFFVMASEVWGARRELAGTLVQLNGGFVRTPTGIECFRVESLSDPDRLRELVDGIVEQASEYFRTIDSVESFLNSVGFGWESVLLAPLQRLLPH